MKSKTADRTAAVRDAARRASNGSGRPGRFNPNRSVRFSTPTDKRTARGRTARTTESEM